MSQKSAVALLDDITDVLGADVYFIYPDSRHSIGIEIMTGIAAGCLVEFLNGFVEFRRLGQATRQGVAGLLEAWRSSRALEPLIQTLDLNHITAEALAAIPPGSGNAEFDAGEAALRQALLKFGMDHALADAHAGAIRRLVQQSPAAKGTS